MSGSNANEQPGPQVRNGVPIETTPLITPNTEEQRSTIGSECLHLFKAAIPISGGYLLQNSIQLASIAIIGQLGPLELSIVASGFMIVTCTGWLLAVGGSTAIGEQICSLKAFYLCYQTKLRIKTIKDALGPRAVVTGPAGYELSTLLYRCLFVSSLMYMPVALLWFFAGSLLVFCGQPLELAFGTQAFLRCLIPFAPGYIYFEILKKFLQCQGHRTPGAFILLFVAVLNLPVCWLVVHKLGFGLAGGVATTGSMYWLAFILLASYTSFLGKACNLHRPTRQLFWDSWPMVRLMLLGIGIVGAEWWGFEMIAIAAGALGDTSIATQSIVMTVDSVFALIPFGLGVASTNRLAHFLASEQEDNAKLVARSSSLLAVWNGCFTMTMILLFRESIARIFTSDIEVITFAIAIFPWAAAFQVVDSLQACNSGCLRAMGRADIAATFNFVAYYIVAIPLGLVVGFYCQWGLHGLWFGLALALAIVGFGECAIVNLVPWTKFVKLGNIEDLGEV